LFEIHLLFLLFNEKFFFPWNCLFMLVKHNIISVQVGSVFLRKNKGAAGHLTFTVTRERE
jgi:hypothetical protein